VGNLSNLVISSNALDMNFQTVKDNLNNRYIFNNNIIYPSSNTGNSINYTLIKYGELTSNFINNTYNITTSNILHRSDFELNNIETALAANIFDVYTFTSTLTNIQPGIIFNFTFYILTYKGGTDSYTFSYKKINRYTIDPPSFLYLTNNDVKLGYISSRGSLLLGLNVPDENEYDNEYLLYINGKSYLNNINTNNINTFTGDNISYNSKNIINLNSLKGSNIDSSNLYSSNGIFLNANIYNLIGSNINMSNMNINNINNKNLRYYNSNLILDGKLTVGKNIEVGNTDTVAIYIDSNINSNITRYTGFIEGIEFYSKYNSLKISDNNNGVNNPCLTIQSTSNIITPYLHINNGNNVHNVNSASYLFRLRNKNNMNIFELCCDNHIYNKIDSLDKINEFQSTVRRKNLGTTNTDYPLHLFQHIKEYNMMTFGEANNLCIDCLNSNSLLDREIAYTNYDGKVSIGVPYKKMQEEYIDINRYPFYFNNVINKDINKYMLNIYGNVKVSSIRDKTVLGIKIPETTSVNEDVRIGINTEPDDENELYVNGKIKAEELYYKSDATNYKSLRESIDNINAKLEHLLAISGGSWPVGISGIT
jgi:hypothetical protein